MYRKRNPNWWLEEYGRVIRRANEVYRKITIQYSKNLERSIMAHFEATGVMPEPEAIIPARDFSEFPAVTIVDIKDRHTQKLIKRED